MRSDNTMSEDFNGPNVCGVFIVRTSPPYNNASSAQGHPEQDVGNNSWLSCCPLTNLDGSAYRYNSAKVHARIAGIQAQVSVVSPNVLDCYGDHVFTRGSVH